MNVLIVIPSRYASTRFPGKPLALIAGKPMVQRVYEKAVESGFPAVVATDDMRIFEAVEDFGGRVVMTSERHKSGTDRCQEAVHKYMQREGEVVDVVINIQGDEPFIEEEQILTLAGFFKDPECEIATLAKPFIVDEGYEVLFDPNKVKLVRGENGNALYFSRSVVPYQRGLDRKEWLFHHTYYLHIGMYAYRTDILEKITRLQQTPLEIAESLEQLRWLEHGYKIKAGITYHQSMGIDTPEDLEKVNNQPDVRLL